MLVVRLVELGAHPAVRVQRPHAVLGDVVMRVLVASRFRRCIAQDAVSNHRICPQLALLALPLIRMVLAR